MKSSRLGRSPLVEVTNISSHGFWLFIESRERFVSFKEFPWFREASIREIANVTLLSPHHLHWPDLDVDVVVDSLDYPIPANQPGTAGAGHAVEEGAIQISGSNTTQADSSRCKAKGLGRHASVPALPTSLRVLNLASKSGGVAIVSCLRRREQPDAGRPTVMDASLGPAFRF